MLSRGQLLTRVNREHRLAHFLVAVVCSEQKTIKNGFFIGKIYYAFRSGIFTNVSCIYLRRNFSSFPVHELKSDKNMSRESDLSARVAKIPNNNLMPEIHGVCFCLSCPCQLKSSFSTSNATSVQKCKSTNLDLSPYVPSVVETPNH